MINSGASACKTRDQFRVLETLRLQHRQVPGQGQFLHRRGSHDLAPAPGPVRLGHHGRHLFPGGQDGLERRQGELGSPHEDQAPGS